MRWLTLLLCVGMGLGCEDANPPGAGLGDGSSDAADAAAIDGGSGGTVGGGEGDRKSVV